MIKLTEHFHVKEFSCRRAGKPCRYCGGSVIADDELLLLVNCLEILRTDLSNHFKKEVYIYIVSGHRCYFRNMEVSTCTPAFKSMHSTVAADIKAKIKGDTDYVHPKLISDFANKIFSPGGVGLYKGHVHVDVRQYTARW